MGGVLCLEPVFTPLLCVGGVLAPIVVTLTMMGDGAEGEKR